MKRKQNPDSSDDTTSDSSSSQDENVEQFSPGTTLAKLFLNEMEEKAKRLAKNRENVRTCRARKKIMVQNLRDDISNLSEENNIIKTENEDLRNKVQSLESAILDHARAATTRSFQGRQPMHPKIYDAEIRPSLLRPDSSNYRSLFQSNPNSLSYSKPRETYQANLRQNMSAISHRQSTISPMIGNDYEFITTALNHQTSANRSHPQNNTHLASSQDFSPNQNILENSREKHMLPILLKNRAALMNIGLHHETQER